MYFQKCVNLSRKMTNTFFFTTIPDFFLLQFVSYVEIINRQLYIIDSKPCEQITWRELTSMLRWPAVPRSMLSCCCTLLHCTCRGLSAVRTLLHPLLAEPYAEGGLVQTVRTGRCSSLLSQTGAEVTPVYPVLSLALAVTATRTCASQYSHTWQARAFQSAQTASE